MSAEELTSDQEKFVLRLANRLIQFRRSASIDVDDLIAAARMRWWQFLLTHAESMLEIPSDILFRQQVKFAMRDVIRESSPVKVTRAYRAKISAYERPYTVSIEHVIDVQAGDTHEDTELWLDVLASIQKLPIRDQMILSLIVERDHSFSDIAYLMDVSVSTVTRAYHKAIEAIRTDLAKDREQL